MTREEYEKIQEVLSYKLHHCFHIGGKTKDGYQRGILDAKYLIRDFYYKSLEGEKESD